MIGSDIQLDYTGNTVIENGDFKTELDSSLSYINRMLVTYPGTWTFHPNLGIGISTYITSENITEKVKNLETIINGLLLSVGLTGAADITINNDTLNVNIISIDPYSAIQETTGFKFNYMNGSITYDTISSEINNTSGVHIKSTNKYRDRR